MGVLGPKANALCCLKQITNRRQVKVHFICEGTSLVAQMAKCLPTTREAQV